MNYRPELTSLNQISAGLKNLQQISHPHVNLDYGGGKYNKGTEWLGSIGVINLVYDKFARTPEHNSKVLKSVTARKPDSVTLLNVLNVIEKKRDRIAVLKDAWSYVKVGGYLKIRVYEGNRSGIGKKTRRGDSYTWQENRKLKDYLDEIKVAIGHTPEAKYNQITIWKNL